jgi:membrane protease YdiL (CAAX protease family)
MLQKLRARPLLTSLLIVGLYGLWFILPMFFVDMPSGTPETGIEGALKMWKPELITAGVLVAIISVLGWWREVGFRAIERGGVKYLIPILLLILFMLNAAWVLNPSPAWCLGFKSPTQLVALLSMILLLGLVEEGVFRGVFFYGLSTRFSPLATVLISAGLFGVFHFVNVFAGASVIGTTFQATHAAAMGFLYASLRLRLGAIWPLMILHGLWDFSLFVLQSATHPETASQGELSLGAGLLVSLPALTYGLFVYWRWSKSSKKSAESLGFSL